MRHPSASWCSPAARASGGTDRWATRYRIRRARRAARPPPGAADVRDTAPQGIHCSAAGETLTAAATGSRPSAAGPGQSSAVTRSPRPTATAGSPQTRGFTRLQIEIVCWSVPHQQAMSNLRTVTGAAQCTPAAHQAPVHASARWPLSCVSSPAACAAGSVSRSHSLGLGPARRPAGSTLLLRLSTGAALHPPSTRARARPRPGPARASPPTTARPG